MFGSVGARLRRLLGARPLPVWYDAAYRLPLSGLDAHLERRRSEFALWALLDRHIVTDIRKPPRASYADLRLVHTARYLESLQDPLTLGRIFAVPAELIPVEALLGLVRLSTGGTVAAAREALAARAPTLNLLGGYHHAAPAQGGGLCPVNDIAVAVAVLRREGFRGRVCVIDLDAHPPDGTAACLEEDARVWIGSLSGADWGPLPGVDETVLPGADDRAYLRALDGLLGRMPRPALAFVLAGGDVLAGDHMGKLGLTLAGVRRRDRRVAEALAGVASVWLPAGGYSHDAWRVLAGTGYVLGGRPDEKTPEGDPLSVHFANVAGTIDKDKLGHLDDLGDVLAELGGGAPRDLRMLGFYTAEGLEYGLEQYGVLAVLDGLGYRDFRMVLDDHGIGVRARLYGKWRGMEVVLIETVVEKRAVADRPVVYVHWLSLRNPRQSFTADRPALPGQDAPGLGLAREMNELFERMAVRLGLAGVGFRPAWYHTAYAARRRFQFVDAARQGRFEALIRDLDGIPLRSATQLVADGKVRVGETPYTWEADEMVALVGEATWDGDRSEQVAKERERVRFSVS